MVSFVANSDSRAVRDMLKEGQDEIEAIVAEMASNGDPYRDAMHHS